MRRHIHSNPFCSHCNKDLETTSHILMECRGLREIWLAAPFNLTPSGTHDSQWLLFRKLKRELPKQEFLVGLVIWWKAWEIRNKEVHGVEGGAPSDLVAWASEFLKVYQEAQAKPLPTATAALPAIWIPPDPGFVKVNVDVAFPVKADFIRIGMVAKRANGETIWWARKEIVGRPQPSDGEALAVVFGVHTAIQQGWRRVIIETDCLPVYRYLSRNSSTLISFGAILDACFALRSSFSSLSFSFVKRSGNACAHAIVTATNFVRSEGAFFPASLRI